MASIFKFFRSFIILPKRFLNLRLTNFDSYLGLDGIGQLLLALWTLEWQCVGTIKHA